MRVSMSRRTWAICNYLLAGVPLGHTPVGGETTILNATRRYEDGVRGSKRASDLRVAFIAAPDGPDVVTSLEDLYTLVTPGSLKTGVLYGDKGLSVGVIVLDLPLQGTVIINTNDSRVDTD
jgi:hypothetical protein